jgi:hypothetical protein
MYIYPALKVTSSSKKTPANTSGFEDSDKKKDNDNLVRKNNKTNIILLSPSVSSTSDNKKNQQVRQDEQNLIQELRRIDAQVRAHEMAHVAAAGGAATSGPRYTYMRGPDGVLYAVGGEVSISMTNVSGSPEATLAKARSIRASALAPGDPSAADLGVAAAAGEMEQQALAAIAAERLYNIQNMQKSANLGMDTDQNKVNSEIRFPDNQHALHQYRSGSMKLKEDSEPLIDMYA